MKPTLPDGRYLLRVPISQYKNRIAEITEVVEQFGASVIITRRGNDVFQVYPLSKKSITAQIGLLKYIVARNNDDSLNSIIKILEDSIKGNDTLTFGGYELPIGQLKKQKELLKEELKEILGVDEEIG